MESEIQQLIDSQTVSPEIGEKLKKLTPGHCCRHKSWGAGQIKEWDSLSNKIIIDFIGKPGHAMEMEYAASSLRPLPDDHIDSKIIRDLDQLKAQSNSEPVELMITVIGSLGKLATIERIESVLSGSVIDAKDWKKWWDSTKKAMKKDGRFEVPSRRTIAIEMHDAPPDRGAMAIVNLKKSTGPKDVIKALEELNRHWKSIQNPGMLDEVLVEVDKILEKLPSSQVHAGIELVLARQEFVAKADAGDPHASHALDRFLPKNPRVFVQILEGLPSAKQSKAVEFARNAWKEDWEQLSPKLLSVGNAKICEEVIRTYRDAGKFDELLAILERLVSERNLHYDFIHWICKNRGSEFRPLVNHNLLAAILSVLELEQLGGSRKASKLERLLLTDKSLVKDLLESATDEQVRDVTRSILSSPAFEELDKRSFLASLVKLYPFVQEMITKAMTGSAEPKKASEETAVLVVSWESLKKRQEELEELVTKKIPENSKEIAVARSYGDLKENHEFKSAKEMQTVLMRRQGELEALLGQAQGTDFRNAETDKVNVGTIVTVSDVASGKKEKFTILGAWDSDPEKGIISYKTGVAQAMMHKKPGDETALIMENGGKRSIRIETIEAYNPA
ncbi:MAG: GreA/GreB family elongation factor [Verrucomicrobiota bacterium]